jgi:DNA polymerase-3 subunit alpha
MAPEDIIKNSIQNTVDALAKKEIVVVISGIPLNDKKTLQLYADGKTKHIYNAPPFMQEYYKQLKNITFDDLVNMSSLTLPGKDHIMDKYIKRRNKLQKVTYLHPILKPILNHTQGLIIFYEQFIEIFKQVGNLTYGESMLLMNHFCTHGINTQEEMEFDYMENPKMKLKFIKNAQIKGFTNLKIKQLIKLVFQSIVLVPRLYHTTNKILLSYQTAYLKTYHPKEYMFEFKKTEFNW